MVISNHSLNLYEPVWLDANSQVPTSLHEATFELVAYLEPEARLWECHPPPLGLAPEKHRQGSFFRSQAWLSSPRSSHGCSSLLASVTARLLLTARLYTLPIMAGSPLATRGFSLVPHRPWRSPSTSSSALQLRASRQSRPRILLGGWAGRATGERRNWRGAQALQFER